MKSLVFILFFSFIFSEADITDSSIIISTSLNSNKLDTVKIDSLITISDHNEFKNLSINTIHLNDIFYEQLIECKLIFADAITYDISLDTIETEIQFRSLFESFEFLDSLSLNDEYNRIEYNKLLNASIDYYQNKSVTVNGQESPLSMALFKEKLEAYFYKQQLEEVEFVDETIDFRVSRALRAAHRSCNSLVGFRALDWLNQSGKPSTRLAIMFSCTSDVPPSIELALERSHSRVAESSLSSKPSPSQPRL